MLIHDKAHAPGGHPWRDRVPSAVHGPHVRVLRPHAGHALRRICHLPRHNARSHRSRRVALLRQVHVLRVVTVLVDHSHSHRVPAVHARAHAIPALGPRPVRAVHVEAVHRHPLAVGSRGVLRGLHNVALRVPPRYVAVRHGRVVPHVRRVVLRAVVRVAPVSPRRLLLLKLHLEPLVPELEAVHALDGVRSRLVILVAHKAKSPRASRALVHHDPGREHGPERREEPVERNVREIVGHVENEEVAALRPAVHIADLDGRARVHHRDMHAAGVLRRVGLHPRVHEHALRVDVRRCGRRGGRHGIRTGARQHGHAGCERDAGTPVGADAWCARGHRHIRAGTVA
mmetsp:Transcript_36864/g.115392  ORF Transcript_36864/g.115392 Transcript_36864/m.115392 type:complete len:343 (-) Transcript_36864:128-1156(-)